MIVLGLDAGSSEIGIALLEVPPGAVGAVVRGRARLLGRGKHGIESTLRIIDNLESFVDLVAIEPPGGVHPGLLKQKGPGAALGVSRHAALGAKLAGRVRGHAEALGMRVVEIPATEWRRALVGRNNASNATIERALRFRIDWTGRSNADERDAAGCALWAAQREALLTRSPSAIAPCPGAGRRR